MPDSAHAHDHKILIPRWFLAACAVMIVFSIAIAAIARWTGYGRVETLPPGVTQVDSRALRFEDSADGAVIVRDAVSKTVVDTLNPGTFGFVRAAMRGLAQARKLHEIGQEPPFLLVRWSDHRVTIDDPTTGRRIDLNAFGRANAEAFERLFDKNREASK
jgi:putative photosynthetic complex assembly protein